MAKKYICKGELYKLGSSMSPPTENPCSNVTRCSCGRPHEKSVSCCYIPHPEHRGDCSCEEINED